MVFSIIALEFLFNKLSPCAAKRTCGNAMDFQEFRIDSSVNLIQNEVRRAWCAHFIPL